MTNTTPQTVTMDYLESLVTGETFLTTPEAPTLTICVLTLKNGFSLRGESACADPRAFNAEKGREFARRDAIQKAWPLEGYLLRQRLWIEECRAAGKPISDADLMGDEAPAAPQA